MNIGSETESIEFKKSTSELPAALISISAILNKHKKGTLYFGVKNNGDICGQQVGNETTRDISRDIRNLIKPECSFEVNIKSTDDGIEFIEVLFSGNRQPYSAEGKYYLRFSDQDRQMTNTELESFFKEMQKDYTEWELSTSNEKIEDVDKELLKNEVNKGYEIKRIPYKYDNAKNIMNKFGLLIKNSNKLNNAGSILFSKNKPILLKLATYATNTKNTFLKLEHFQGNIYECIEKSLAYILENIDWRINIDGSIKRKEEPEIPKTALREIIINAFSHADYNSNTTFEISIYKNRVSIYSPGFFPNGFTPEDFAYKHEEPIMLNPKIINVLFKTNEIESFGYGFDKTFKECKKYSVDYDYQNTKSGFKFTFYRPLGQKNVHEMSKTENEVFKLINDNNYLSGNEMAKILGKSEKTIYRAIKRLKELGLIERIGSDTSGYWHIIM